MKPVYFPYTYIKEAVAEDLCACLKQVTLYQPSGQNIPEKTQILAQKGLVDLKVPVSGDELKLESLIKEYNKWGEIHQKSGISFLAAKGERVPFFDDTMSSQIASQIKKIEDQKKSEEEPDALFNARLFLCIAQVYDLQQDILSKELLSVSEMEKKLVEGLRGEDEDFYTKYAGNLINVTDEAEHHMVKERLDAWVHLMAHDKELPGFFVTNNKDAFDYIIEKAGDSQKVIELPHIPIFPQSEVMRKWQEMLLEQIEGLSKDDNYKINKKLSELPAAEKIGREISLTIFRVINKSRHQLLTNLLGQKGSGIMANDNYEINKSVLIGLAEPSTPTA